MQQYCYLRAEARNSRLGSENISLSLKNMNQITPGQRYEIAVLKQQDCLNVKISHILDKNKSTIGREFKRNSDLRNGI